MILTVDIVRMGIMGYFYIIGKKQINFPTSVGLKNIFLYELGLICIFLSISLKDKIGAAISLLILFLLYIVLVITH